MKSMNSTIVINARRSGLFLVLALMAACSAVPPKDEPATSEPTTSGSTTRAGEPQIVSIEPVRPKVELTKDILYKILLAEFAGQRGFLDISVENYLDLAHRTRDPKIVERATRIAVYARNSPAAAEAAVLWLELDPRNADAHQVLAVMALRRGDLETTLAHLQEILAYSEGDLSQKMWMIVNLLGREQDKKLVMTVMERLLADRQDDPEAIYAFANIAARMGELERATDLLEQTLELVPDNENAAMSYITILQKQGRSSDAVVWLEKELPRHKGDDFNLRMAYARLLTDVKRFEDARGQFEILAKQEPDNEDVLFALGLLNLQSNRLEESERYFKRLSEDNAHASDANYYLGRIAEDRKDYEQAGVWYQAVDGGENYFDAKVRVGLLKAKTSSVEDAIAHLKTIQTRNPQQATLLAQAEGELLVQVRRYEDAMVVFNKALMDKYNADLLYSRAMLAEKMGKLDILEQDLRRILAKEPEHAQALNALGYTLADRTDRYEEAYELIERAMALNPNDFYVLDSMGWVLYRLGRHEEAVQYLRRAMDMRPDSEIAAHLGEVLWVMGDKKAAKEIWDTALKTTPDDKSLLNVIERFNPNNSPR